MFNVYFIIEWDYYIDNLKVKKNIFCVLKRRSITLKPSNRGRYIKGSKGPTTCPALYERPVNCD